MGGHHHQLPEIPDWRIYRVEDVPELMRVKKALAKHGLSDPWLRNEVWKYTEFSQKITKGQMIKKVAFHGFKYGVIAAAITIGIEMFFVNSKKKKHGDH